MPEQICPICGDELFIHYDPPHPHGCAYFDSHRADGSLFKWEDERQRTDV